ncbi:UNVERIFIED_CONTAM: hypothetical protein K2H54_054114 [Gekko kuhli]
MTAEEKHLKCSWATLNFERDSFPSFLSFFLWNCEDLPVTHFHTISGTRTEKSAEVPVWSRELKKTHSRNGLVMVLDKALVRGSSVPYQKAGSYCLDRSFRLGGSSLCSHCQLLYPECVCVLVCLCVRVHSKQCAWLVYVMAYALLFNSSSKYLLQPLKRNKLSAN